MRYIHKHRIRLNTVNEYVFPPKTKILKFAEQRGELFIWVEKPDAPAIETRFFRVIATGGAFVEGKHRGTCLAEVGERVWHLYETHE